MNYKLLIYLAEYCNKNKEIESTTGKIAEDLRISQQSISRILIALEDQELIKREPYSTGIKIKLCEKGISLLKKQFNTLKEFFSPIEKLNGKVTQGLGEGAYYMKTYTKKIKSITGYEPYPGTLNLKVNPKEIQPFLSDIKFKEITGFKKKERTFGNIKLYNIIIEGTKGAIIMPERSTHKEDIIEIIGPTCFRSSFNLHEKDNIELNKV